MVNIVFASFGACYIVLLIISLGLAFFLTPHNPTTGEMIDETMGVCFSFMTLFFFVTLILKIILFPILYKMKRIFPTIHTFFNKFRDEKKLQITIFSLALLIILLDFFWQFNENDFWYFESLFGFGLIPSYLIMLVFLKIQKRKDFVSQ